VLAAIAGALLAAGCGPTRCEDYTPVAIGGTYKGGGSLGGERLLNVSLEAGAKQVTLTYTDLDGARVKATYRVLKKSRGTPEASR